MSSGPGNVQALDIYDEDGDLHLGKLKRAVARTEEANWNESDGSFYAASSFRPPPQVQELPAGMYQIEAKRPFGLYFRPMPMKGDELIRWEGSPVDFVTKNIETFWTKEEHYRQLGASWKRGILLYGPPGTGKTSIIRMLARDVAKRNGIVLAVDDIDYLEWGLALFRRVEPKRPLVVVMEDIEKWMMHKKNGDTIAVPQLLKLLDGEIQYDNIVYLATTNFFDKLDPRVANRPSRFDIVQEITFPRENDRAGFLITKHPKRFMGNQTELDEWVSLTEGFTPAHLKELILAVEVYELPVKEATRRLRKMIKAVGGVTQLPTIDDEDGDF